MKKLITTTFILLTSSFCWAQKLNFDGGFYSINAIAPSGSTTDNISLSGPGAYSLSANFVLHPQIELSPGYTVFFSKIYRGDMGLGPDFTLYAFPLNAGSGLKIENNKLSYIEIESIRPYVGFSFHQRQFQSTQSSYSGFGFDLGAEFQTSLKYSFRVGLRSMSLTGPSDGSIKYTDVLVGYQIHY